MSQHYVIEMDLDDECSLVEALKEMGFQPEVKETTVNGYAGANWGKATVVVRGKTFGGYTDIGFQKVNGKYKMHMDSMDSRKIDKNKLVQLHAKHKIAKHIKNKPGKYRLKKIETDKLGNIKIRVGVK
jgi:hypothetical protein